MCAKPVSEFSAFGVPLKALRPNKWGKRVAKLRSEKMVAHKPPSTVPHRLRHGLVYVLRADSIKSKPGHAVYKIGKTSRPAKRLGQLNVIVPFGLIVVIKLECSDAYLAEAILHKHFGDKHINGEWYELNGEDLEYIKSAIASL